MQTTCTRRNGVLASIEVSPSRNSDDMLFMINPPVCELTEDQTRELIDMLTAMYRQKWGNYQSDEPPFQE